MDFTHNEDRQMLSDTLGRYLQQRYPIDVRNANAASDAGWSADHWAALAEMGIVGAMLDETAGGFGGDGFDIAVTFEQFGRALVVEPLLGALVAGRALALAGGQQNLIDSAIAGTAVLAFAHEEPQSFYEASNVATRADRGPDGWTLTGAKAVVPQLDAASHIVVSARIEGGQNEDNGIGLFLIEKEAPGLTVRGYPLIDGGKAGELTLGGTAATLLAEDALDLIEEAVAAGTTALCWEAIGIMDVMKASTLDYLRVRKQFGIAIGRFQALQHRMATVAIEIEQARSAAINAAAALSEDRVRRERAVSAAKFTIGRVGTIVTEESIQLHGGIGMTDELPLSHYAKRLTMIGHQLGDENHHLSRFIALDQAS